MARGAVYSNLHARFSNVACRVTPAALTTRGTKFHEIGVVESWVVDGLVGFGFGC